MSWALSDFCRNLRWFLVDCALVLRNQQVTGFTDGLRHCGYDAFAAGLFASGQGLEYRVACWNPAAYANGWQVGQWSTLATGMHE